RRAPAVLPPTPRLTSYAAIAPAARTKAAAMATYGTQGVIASPDGRLAPGRGAAGAARGICRCAGGSIVSWTDAESGSMTSGGGAGAGNRPPGRATARGGGWRPGDRRRARRRG